MKRILLCSLLVAVIGSVSAVVASSPVAAIDRWYAGNNQTSVYGVKADIYTPSSAPYVGNYYGEASYVSTISYSGRWVQTGWILWANNSSAEPYVEIGTGILSDIYYYGTQAWGSYKNYKVQYEAYDDSWNAYIDGSFKAGYSGSAIPDAPNAQLTACAEIRGSNTTELNTDFNSVSWRNSSGVWNLFDQNNLWAESPYHWQGQVYHYLVYGP